MTALTLYYHPLASFCHKVLIALYENGTPFEGRVIDLANEAEKAELQALWPVGKFPVIRDHVRSRAVPETTVIVEYLDRHFPGPRPMIPTDWDDALEVRLWDRFFDNYVQGPMQRIVNDRLTKANGNMAPEREALTLAYRMLEQHLMQRTWVSQQGFSLADCAAAPGLFYAHTLQPFPDGCTRVIDYFDRLMARPSVARVMDEAKPYLKFYPFFEAIPKRFL